MASGHQPVPQKQAEQMAAPTSTASPSRNPLPTGSRPRLFAVHANADEIEEKLGGHRPGGPHLGVKQAKSGAKRTLPLEGLLSGVERSDRRHGPNSRL